MFLIDKPFLQMVKGLRWLKNPNQRKIPRHQRNWENNRES